MPRWAKTFIGILLLPLCVAAVKALWRVLQATTGAETIWVALGSGAACWWVVFLMLPTPMRLYVFGHELTHVLWGWMFGARLKKFRTTATGGQVVITRTNFLITLAPYFFPLYAGFIAGVFLLGDLYWGWTEYQVWLHFLVGSAYAFHLTLTWHILQYRQPDLASEGYLFSGVVIFLGNAGVLLVGIPLLTARVTCGDALLWWWDESAAGWIWLWHLL